MPSECSSKAVKVHPCRGFEVAVFNGDIRPDVARKLPVESESGDIRAETQSSEGDEASVRVNLVLCHHRKDRRLRRTIQAWARSSG